ncbi:MAG: GNAT family N-acetyltransferase, partial [Acidimicrobiia bacterium]|nr:GNAT family N-acetyltransferase [Acidimicrobiia bacterium]
ATPAGGSGSGRRWPCARHAGSSIRRGATRWRRAGPVGGRTRSRANAVAASPPAGDHRGVLEILPLGAVDPEAVIRQDERAFGFRYDRVSRPVARADVADMRGWAAVDRGEVVAFVGARPCEVTLPGGCPVAAAGVTWVSVAATHRRRGIASQLMGRMHAEALERGEPLAVLIASEGGIYGRFGYGVATWRRVVRLDRRAAGLATPFEDPGRARYVEGAAALDACRAAYERYRVAQPGAVSRREPWWQRAVAMKTPQWVVHEDGDGVVDGFTVYSNELHWDYGHPASRVSVDDLVTATPEAREALWRVLLGLDLVGTVETTWLSPDDPLEWQLADRRALRTVEVLDGMWACPLDVAVALGARRYLAGGTLVLEVEGARFRLDAGEGGAEACPTGSEADLVLGRGALGSILFGGVRPTVLVAARRVVERVAGAATVADRMFLGERMPHCNTAF